MATTSSEHLPSQLVGSPGFMLTRLGGDARRRLGDALAREGLKIGDYAAIALLDELESCPQQVLSRTLNIDRSNVVDIVDRLEGAGFARRRPDPADRRRYAVKLTAKGRGMVERCAAAARAVDDELLDGLEPAERDALMSLLHRVAARHDEHVSLARCVDVD
jgi:DNA-binding MarR family transcriptional regulator